MGLIPRFLAGRRAAERIEPTFEALRETSPLRETSLERLVVFNGLKFRLTPESALQLATVWACVTVIAQAIASCVWDVFSEDGEGNRVPRRRTSTWQLLNVRPNPEMTPFAMREALVMQAALWGNAYAEIERDMAGRPVNLYPLDPERCCLERDVDSRELFLRVKNWDRDDSELPYDDVFHLHGPSLDGVAGYNPILLAARSIHHAIAAEQFGVSFYDNKAQFGGLLSTDKALGDPEIERLREQINQRHVGADQAFKFLITGGGLSYSALGVAPEQAQFIETRQYLVEEVCRWFHVPPHKVGHLLRATFSNIEHQGLEFVRDTLIPWCERLRQEADWKLLPSAWRGFRTRIDTEWLAEGDAKSKAESDVMLVLNGIESRNEVRRRRGLNTRIEDGADSLTVQMQTVPIEKAVAQEVGGPPAPVTPDPDEDDDDDDTDAAPDR